MKKEELLAVPVSFYRHMKSWSARPMTIGRVFNGICGDYYKLQVEQIRKLKSQGKNNEADEIKENLHAVTFCATFDGRRLTELCQRYNSLMVIDIDKLDDTEMERVADCLLKDDYVACFWKSPSGKGWKGLVPLEYDSKYRNVKPEDKHFCAFIQLEDYFKKTHNIVLDKSGKDITRLCFMSWSPELIVKASFLQYTVNYTQPTVIEKSKVKENYSRINATREINWNAIDGRKQEHERTLQNKKLITRIYKYLKSRHLSITSSYDEWVKVAFAIANTFHSVYGRRIFMQLCELDGAAHDPLRSENLIYDAYTEQDIRSDFSTIIYLAEQKGFSK